ncbi:MAG: acyltransferase [Proteobacteria bacterium]|nr:acyltransferase [Pseudomonadota bacterium]
MLRFRTLADDWAAGGDNFLLLRFIAAALVIYGHAPAIVGSDAQDFFLRLGWGRYSGAIAVDLFFVISGFLVTASWQRHPHFGDFLRARALRILPAYVVCLLATALVLGPLCTTLAPASYFSQPQTWRYLWTNLHFGPHLAWRLPGVFVDHATQTVNGSIWTLPIEVSLYAGVAAFGLFGLLKRTWCSSLLLALAAIAVAIWVEPNVKTPYPDYLHMAGLFALGSLCWIWRQRVPNHGGVALACAALTWLAHDTPVATRLFSLAETAFVFWFAYRLGTASSPLRRFNRCGDYSYGLYLWGYPAQQVAVAIVGSQSTAFNAVCGFAIALPIAMASWHWIEAPALRYKRSKPLSHRADDAMPLPNARGGPHKNEAHPVVSNQ